MSNKWICVLSDYIQATCYACSQIRSISELWLIVAPIYCRLKYGLGARDFTIYQLPRVALREWSQFLQNEPFKRILASQASAYGRQLADDKHAFYQHCWQHQLPTPQLTCLLCAPDSEQQQGTPQLHSADQLCQFLPDGQYFVKPQRGSHGQHAFAFVRHGDAVITAQGRSRIQSFAHQVFQRVRSGIPLIVQPQLVNHPSIRQLTGSPHLSTIRVVTAMEQGEIRAIGSFFRIINGNNQTDSFCHGSSGNLIAAVDVQEGRLLSTKCVCNKSWPVMAEISQHPRTGVTLQNFMLPRWQEVLATVFTAHKTMPFLKTIGWDVAVSADMVWVVEANWRYDIDALQVAHTKGFAAAIKPFYAIRT